MSIMIWGHRGHRHHRYAGYETPAAENSLKAYEYSLARVMGVEVDVVQSRQGTPFMVHDTQFDGLVHYALKGQLDADSAAKVGARYIYQMDDEEIKTLRLKDGQALPSLWALLEMMPKFPNRVLNLELKGPLVADPTARMVEKAFTRGLITQEQVVFSSFSLPALSYLREHIGQRFRVCMMFTEAGQGFSQMYPNWPGAPQDGFYIPFNMDDKVLDRPDLHELLPDFVNLEAASVTRETIDLLHRKFPFVKIIMRMAGEPYPKDNSAMIDTIMEYGASGMFYAIISDYPEELQRELLDRGVPILKPLSLQINP